jgi:hypothetical protein
VCDSFIGYILEDYDIVNNAKSTVNNNAIEFIEKVSGKARPGANRYAYYKKSACIQMEN